MNTNRILSAILLAAMTLTSAACSSASDNPTETSAEETSESNQNADSQDSEISDDLPDRNYNGTTFTILDRTKYMYEFSVTEENGDLLNDATYKRNIKVEERFGIDLTTHTVDCMWGEEATEFNNMLRASVMSGDGAFDLVAGYAAAIPALVADGIFMNWAELDYIDFTKPWWAEEVANELTINGKNYMITGDLSLALWKGMNCFFFNKRLAEEYKIEDIYSIVKNGEWTFDKLIELTNNVYEDLNGDGIRSEDDKYGFLCVRNTEIDNMKEAFELHVTEKGEDGFPKLVFNNERTVEIVQRLNSYIHDSGFVLLASAEMDADIGRQKFAQAFSEGRGLFFASTLGVSEKLRSMDDDFGIIPYPKYNSVQKDYHSTSLDEFSLFLVPNDVKDSEMTAIITEALCAESYKTVVPVFYDTALKTKAARDNDSSEMIDIIRDSLTFDWGYLHSNAMGGVGHLFVDLIRNNNNNVASEYQKNAAMFEQKLEEILEIYR